jgi:23S rRNA (uracil1939-C5)-methyltransferase
MTRRRRPHAARQTASDDRRRRLKAGDTIELRIDALDKRGSAAGEHEGLTVYAPGPLPGEVARITLEHVGRRSRAWGRLDEILEPSPHRRHAPCPHQGTCGGCPLMIAEEEYVAETKRRMLAELGIEVDRVVRDDRPLRYRWSSKRVIQRSGTAARIVAGSYRPGTHELATMRSCLVDHPDIAACFDELEDVARRFPDGAERLRYAWAKTDGRGNVLLTLVLHEVGDAHVDALADALTLPAGIASCVQESEGNAMRGHALRHLRGKRELVIALSGVDVHVGPQGFLQPNPPVAALAYPDLVGSSKGVLAFDLYAGAGVTTHLLRLQYDDVRACEVEEESARLLDIAPQSAEAFLAAQSDDPDLVVANPPRAGLGPAVCEALVASALRSRRPMRLHVMSCEPRALARDLERLTEAGTFEIVGARAYDTLPQTAHIEVVVWLRKKKFADSERLTSARDDANF